jgi:hypothetical protein
MDIDIEAHICLGQKKNQRKQKQHRLSSHTFMIHLESIYIHTLYSFTLSQTQSLAQRLNIFRPVIRHPREPLCRRLRQRGALATTMAITTTGHQISPFPHRNHNLLHSADRSACDQRGMVVLEGVKLVEEEHTFFVIACSINRGNEQWPEMRGPKVSGR